MKFIYVLVLISLTLGCEGGENIKMGSTQIKYVDTLLNIPNEYIISTLPDSIIGGEGLDAGDEISLKVPLQSLGVKSLTGVTLVENVILLISASNAKFRSQDAIDAENMTGSYKEAIVSFDKVSQNFRVYSKSGYPKIWHYFSGDPRTKTTKNEWLSSCYVGPLTDEKNDLSNVTCKSNIYYKDITIQITTRAKNMAKDSSLNENITGIFKQWDATYSH